jgi:hypothetical protein
VYALDRRVVSALLLTSSLKLPDGSTTGIEITGSGVSVDLNGFTIGCFPGICAAGTGRAIFADKLLLPIPPTTIRIHNGTVQGAGSVGIELGLLSAMRIGSISGVSRFR